MRNEIACYGQRIMIIYAGLDWKLLPIQGKIEGNGKIIRERKRRDMKIDRLIGIITTLQQQKFVTAPYLAEKFEVSRRTINRDIEDICKAGIPIVTTQGANGGKAVGYCRCRTCGNQRNHGV